MARPDLAANLEPTDKIYIRACVAKRRRDRAINSLPLVSMILASLFIIPFAETLIPIADSWVLPFQKYLPGANYSSLLSISAAAILGMAMLIVYLLAWSGVAIILRRA